MTVLDIGYVRLVDWMGDDLSVTNAARASYMKETTAFRAADERLIAFL
ncbi:MAG: thymidylate synthase (FAD), partial [Chloroflexi bacterium]|nr:thymidylate synthase (FAD) [Chloroflexota bacterium]